MKNSLLLLALAIIISGCSTNHNSMDKSSKTMMKAPFGNTADTTYADILWQDLNKYNLNSTPATLYVGGPPHGKVREVLEGNINGRRVIVKRNYGGEGVSVEAVKENRAKYLKAITVMAKQETGYDPDNHNWFWAKYKPDGRLHKNPKGMLLAGRVAKGMDKGCIACHKSASGSDMVFVHNKEAQSEIIKVK